MKKIPLAKIKANPNNPRFIKDESFAKLVQSIKDFPEMLALRPIVVDDDMVVLGGNMRLRACHEAGLKKVEVIEAKNLSEEQKKEFIIKDNLAFGSWDFDLLANEWDADLLEDWGLELSGFEEPTTGAAIAREKLSERFTVPPFTILDTRQGYWAERKGYWNELIGDKGESREAALSKADNIMKDINNGASILDPVLAEIANRWFGIPKGTTFDCFAGDSVFGYVSDALGCKFVGIELRAEQTDLNNERLKGSKSKYICDDGRNVLHHVAKESQDLLFSCPPYFDLEVYSELPNDASNQGNYADFLAILQTAFGNAIECLKPDRFAFIVVGDIRAKSGEYLRFVDDVKNIFCGAGMVLYNEMILVEKLGTLPQRVGRYMNNRKVGKCHQNILVFYKGDIKNIPQNFAALEFNDLEDGSEDL